MKDPRNIPGSMSGPGGPHDIGGVVLDTRNAVLMETVSVSTIDPDRGARGQASAITLVLGGRINQTKERVSVLFIFGTDGAAAIITELVGLLGRSGNVDGPQLMADLLERAATMAAGGDLS